MGLRPMKKTYISPAMNVTKVVQSLPIAYSPSTLLIFEEDATDEAMVKSTSSRMNYNVWDDDWSEGE